jgi:hypothetical protein
LLFLIIGFIGMFLVTGFIGLFLVIGFIGALLPTLYHDSYVLQLQDHLSYSVTQLLLRNVTAHAASIVPLLTRSRLQQIT